MIFSVTTDFFFVTYKASDGEICGSGAQEGKDNLLYYNILSCSQSHEVSVCLTKQICVAKCPEINMSPLLELEAGRSEKDIVEEIRPFCETDKLHHLPLRKIIEV